MLLRMLSTIVTMLVELIFRKIWEMIFGENDPNTLEGVIVDWYHNQARRPGVVFSKGPQAFGPDRSKSSYPNLFENEL